jgi:hypothetical protein
MKIVAVDYPAPAGDMAPRSFSDITDLIIHHSDGSPNQSPLDIDQEHRAEGWDMIGYNYVIAGNGTIYKGRPDQYEPSAAYGRNMQSVNVCLLGDFQTGTPGAQSLVPDAQLTALKQLALLLHQKFPTIERTIGHGDVATLFYPGDPGDYSTACPGNVLESHLPELRAYVAAQLHR